MRKSYSEKLTDPRWQKRRLKVLEYAHWRCQICGAKDKTLHCHHSYYTKGKEPWQYPDGAIIAVCDPCHQKIHAKPAPPVVAPEPVWAKPEWENLPVPKIAAENRFAAMKKMLEEQ